MPVSGWVRPEIWCSHYKWPDKLLCFACEGPRTEFQMHRNPTAKKSYEANNKNKENKYLIQLLLLFVPMIFYIVHEYSSIKLLESACREDFAIDRREKARISVQLRSIWGSLHWLLCQLFTNFTQHSTSCMIHQLYTYFAEAPQYVKSVIIWDAEREQKRNSNKLVSRFESSRIISASQLASKPYFRHRGDVCPAVSNIVRANWLVAKCKQQVVSITSSMLTSSNVSLGMKLLQ